MSQENVEVAHAVMAAYNRGGLDAALKHFDANVELVAPPNWPDQSVLWGHDGMRKIQAEWDEKFYDFGLDLERLIDRGDHGVLVLFTQRGRIKGSDRELEQPTAQHYEFRDGKVTRACAYFSWAEALKAMGLEE